MRIGVWRIAGNGASHEIGWSMIAYMACAKKIIGLLAAIVLTGCATTFDQDGAIAIAPYHVDSSGRIVIEASINGIGPFDFAVDTGATISAVFHDLRDELALDNDPNESVVIRGVLSSKSVPLLIIRSLGVGNEVWLDPRIALLPDTTTADDGFDGILGNDFLRRYAVGFSTRDQVIRLYPPDLTSRRSYKGWASVPLELYAVDEGVAPLYFFEVAINGKKLTALFDLGAGLNVINWPAARRFGIEPGNFRRNDSIEGVFDSAPVNARLNAKLVTTNNITWRNERFIIADVEVFAKLNRDDYPAAILGAGLFTQRDFVIDFLRNRLLVRVEMDELDSHDTERGRTD